MMRRRFLAALALSLASATLVVAPAHAAVGTQITSLSCTTNVGGTVTWSGKDPAKIGVTWNGTTAGEFTPSRSDRRTNTFGFPAPSSSGSWTSVTVTLFDSSHTPVAQQAATCG